MPVYSSQTTDRAPSNASPRGWSSLCCPVLACSAFQPPSSLTPLVAGTRTSPCRSKCWTRVLTHLNQFSHNPFPLPSLPHEVSELMCTHVPVTRLMPITDSERMKKKKKEKGIAFLREEEDCQME